MSNFMNKSSSDDELEKMGLDEGFDTKDGNVNKYLKVLQKSFGHTSFRALQWDIIKSSLIEKQDQCIVMATGYGKSLCFQYPSVYSGGCTIVISPLISLMEDQVLSLTVAGIEACFLGSAQQKQTSVISRILQNEYRLVYLTPEFCTGDSGQKLLREMNDQIEITLIAIDEAHCVSKWGHDFRPSYLQLWKIRNLLPNVPILAVTATATEVVQKDICKSLRMRNPQFRCSGFDRPNLYFEVRPKGNKNEWENLCEVLKQNMEGSTIIYALTKKETENLCELLQYHDIKCEAYHAGLSLGKRKAVHEQFTRDELKIIVATIAFGMGIDKPDVRLIIHYGAAKDFESYYQEVGRAGRDGLPSTCITFFSSADFIIHDNLRKGSSSQFRNSSSALNMKTYLYSTDCRRRQILAFFAGKTHDTIAVPTLKRCCDNCTSRSKVSPALYCELDKQGRFDFTKDCELLLKTITTLNGRYGFNMYIKFLQGAKIQKINETLRKSNLFGVGRHRHENWWKAIGRLLELEHFLTKTNYLSAYTIDISEKGQNYLSNIKNGKSLEVMKKVPPQDILPYLKKKIIYDSDEDDYPIKFKNTVEPAATSTTTLTSEFSHKLSRPLIPTTKQNTNHVDNMQEKVDEELYRKLRTFRNELASTHGCMPYMVATDTALIEMIQVKPLTIEDFQNAKLNGFNDKKIKKFGTCFISYLNLHFKAAPKISDKPQALQETLCKYPFGKNIFISSARLTCDMFKSGKTVEEISTIRNLAASTISAHLKAGLRAGYPLMLNNLLTRQDQVEAVIKECAHLNPDNFLELKYAQFQEKLPQIEWNEFSYVTSYLAIRQHLENIQKEYQDHDPSYYTQFKNLKQGLSSEEMTSTSTLNINTETLLAEAAECLNALRNDTESARVSGFSDSDDELFRESPPRVIGQKYNSNHFHKSSDESLNKTLCIDQ